jgi:hypothetical protein
LPTLKYRTKGEPYNTLTIRLGHDIYNRILQYARYGQDVPMSISLAMQDLAERGLKDAVFVVNPHTGTLTQKI